MVRLVACLLATLLAGAAAAPAAEARAPVAVGVGAREFSLSVYRTSVTPGPVRFNLTNFGEDGHDLTVLGPSGLMAGTTTEVPGLGGRGRVELRLRRPGRYTLLCTVGDHAARGMRTTLRVARPG